MRKMPFAAIALCALLALATVAVAIPADPDRPLMWETDFTKALHESRVRNKPLLALSNLKNCPYCRAFQETLDAPEIIRRLRRYVLLRVDVEADAYAADELDLRAAPTAAAFLPAGNCLGRHQGYAEVDAFAEWLDEMGDLRAALGPNLLREKPAKLVSMLGGQDPLLREAVTQALLAHAAKDAPETAKSVVETFLSGGLGVRLGALEVLTAWDAPVGEADPWKPDTVPPVAEALRAWAEHAEAPTASRHLSEDMIDAELQRWMTDPDGLRTQAIYERLSRVGPDLLPRIRELTPPTWDLRYERLTALRYRLLMPLNLALTMPQAPFQMASNDPETRAAALDTITTSVRAAGNGEELQEFFLEAFTDPDGKVRECALRGLRETGTRLAKPHVVKLLADPSPDVRADILNDLARAPLPDMAHELAQYVAQEKREDLVVHAVRALRGVRSRSEAFKAILSLISHDSWRVRAEAIEALGNVWTRSDSLDNLSDKQQVAAAVALRRAFQDKDPFVLAKALEVVRQLPGDYRAEDLTALIAAMKRFPSLAVPVLEVIGHNPGLLKLAVKELRELCSDERSEVRAAALRTLLMSTDVNVAEEALAGLKDTESSVRQSAAESLAMWLDDAGDELRYSSGWYGGYYSSSGNDTESAKKAANAIPKEVRENFIAALRKMASAEEVGERFAAHQALILLGDVDIALAGLREAASSEPKLAGEVIGVMGGLDWPARKELFDILRTQPMTEAEWGHLFSVTFAKAPEEARPLIWEIVQNDPHLRTSAESIIRTILLNYGIKGALYSKDPNASASALSALKEQAETLMQGQDPVRQAFGLLLLCRADRKGGETEAKRLVAAPEMALLENRPLRTAAVEILMAMADKKYEKLAIETLGSTDEKLRTTAMHMLATLYGGMSDYAKIRIGESEFWVSFLSKDTDYGYYMDYSSGRPKAWEPEKPSKDLDARKLRPFLEANDPALQAGAAYLLALMGERSGLSKLVGQWRAEPDDYSTRRLTIKAIAALNDDEDVQILREMYDGFDSDDKEYYGKNLYWTIRRMNGPKAKELRSAMRKELGSALVR